ncbi:ABC transporter permease [Vibrio zhugei]|uniref:ABC transporter permease n=1 Tax=Vibrio zhugei TaxID=2479546 RepID=A0ABV7CBT9_9VIBR|nr:iron ABC transporter permease [Vibrio zhugei]
MGRISDTQVASLWCAKLKHTVAFSYREPANWMGILLVSVFAYVILAPIVSIMLNAGIVQVGDATRIHAMEGTWTGYYLMRALASRMSNLLVWTPLIHTVVIALTTVIFSVIIGVTLAWFVNRTDIAGRKWFLTALIVPFMLPSWTFALAWKTVFKNGVVGGQPGWLTSMGIETPNWLAYGYVPTIVILTLHFTPMVILIVGNAMKRFDSQLEDCARILGASRRTIAWSIMLPMMRPALMSAALLIFADCIGEFAIPYILGLPVHFDTLSTQLYRSLNSRQNGVAAVIALVIMLMGMLTLLLDLRMMREAKRFITIGGKGGMERVSQLGRWRWLAALFPCSFIALGVVIPLVILFLSTVMILPGRFTFDNFTWDFWVGRQLDTVALKQGILLTPDFWHSMGNTLLIVGSASIASGILGLFVGYTVMRCSFQPLSRFLRQITFLPYLVPGIAFATAFLSLFAESHGPIPALYGTPFLLIIALIAEKMPYASRSGIVAMTQLGKEPEDAAQLAGAGWLTRMTHIIIPIQKGPLVTGILLPFISGIKGVSLFIILAIPSTDVLTTYSLRLIDYNYDQAANAVVLMIALIAWLGTVAIQTLSGNALSAGLEN